jgi:hypothetical protein
MTRRLASLQPSRGVGMRRPRSHRRARFAAPTPPLSPLLQQILLAKKLVDDHTRRIVVHPQAQTMARMGAATAPYPVKVVVSKHMKRGQVLMISSRAEIENGSPLSPVRIDL